MLQSPQGQALVDHELGALPLDWVQPKPFPKILIIKKKLLCVPSFMHIYKSNTCWPIVELCKLGRFYLSKGQQLIVGRKSQKEDKSW